MTETFTASNGASVERFSLSLEVTTREGSAWLEPFNDCFDTDGTLMDAMLEKLDHYEPRPQPKPGDEAQDGEYWSLTFDEGQTGLFKRNNGEWRHEGKKRKPLDERWRTIITAERIWPKDAP